MPDRGNILSRQRPRPVLPQSGGKKRTRSGIENTPPGLKDQRPLKGRQVEAGEMIRSMPHMLREFSTSDSLSYMTSTINTLMILYYGTNIKEKELLKTELPKLRLRNRYLGRTKEGAIRFKPEKFKKELLEAGLQKLEGNLLAEIGKKTDKHTDLAKALIALYHGFGLYNDIYRQGEYLSATQLSSIAEIHTRADALQKPVLIDLFCADYKHNFFDINKLADWLSNDDVNIQMLAIIVLHETLLQGLLDTEDEWLDQVFLEYASDFLKKETPRDLKRDTLNILLHLSTKDWINEIYGWEFFFDSNMDQLNDILSSDDSNLQNLAFKLMNKHQELIDRLFPEEDDLPDAEMADNLSSCSSD